MAAPCGWVVVSAAVVSAVDLEVVSAAAVAVSVGVVPVAVGRCQQAVGSGQQAVINDAGTRGRRDTVRR